MIQEEIYAIHQVSDMFAVSQTTIRNWEKELEGLIEIRRDGQGSRYYTKQDIQRFQLVQKLRDDGFSLQAVRKIFEKLVNGEDLSAFVEPQTKELTTQQPDTVPKEQVEAIASELIKNMGPFLQQVIQEEVSRQVAVAQQQLLPETTERNDAFMEQVKDVIREASVHRDEEYQQEIQQLRETLQEEARQQMREMASFSKDEVSRIMAEQRNKGFFARLFGK